MKKAAKSPIPSRETNRLTSPSMEQYIETIAHLLTKDKVCSVSDIAEEAQVSRPAASRAVRDLAEKNLVEHKAYRYVDLTPQGQSLAERLTARHEALYFFLRHVLNFEDDYADEEACRLEHQLDDDTATRLSLLSEFLASDTKMQKRWSDMLSERMPQRTRSDSTGR
jgi:DtxR family transcriptional regulator, Mn-dependent transcriptional regulator